MGQKRREGNREGDEQSGDEQVKEAPPPAKGAARCHKRGGGGAGSRDPCSPSMQVEKCRRGGGLLPPSWSGQGSLATWGQLGWLGSPAFGQAPPCPAVWSRGLVLSPFMSPPRGSHTLYKAGDTACFLKV